MCKIAPFAVTLSVNVSIITLVAISLDRYHVILYPFRPKLGMRQCYLILMLIWTVSIVLSCFKLVCYRAEYKPWPVDKVICEPTYIQLYKYETLFLVVVQYVVPFALIAYTYARIAHHIYYEETPANAHRNDVGRMHVKRKVCHHLTTTSTTTTTTTCFECLAFHF